MNSKIRKYSVINTSEYDNSWLRETSYGGMEDVLTNLESALGVAGTFFLNLFPILSKLRLSNPIASNSQDINKLFQGYKDIRSQTINFEVCKKNILNKIFKTDKNFNLKQIEQVTQFVNQIKKINATDAKSLEKIILSGKSFQDTGGKNARRNFADMLALIQYYKQECDIRSRTMKPKKTKLKTTKSFNKNNKSINKFSQGMLYTNKTGYHNEFYRDALSGLGSSDPLLKSFYKELQQEYHKDLNIKPQKRGDLMDFFHEEAHIMSKAHPESIVIADAPGGELLENNFEKHKKLVDIAQRRPLGNFR